MMFTNKVYSAIQRLVPEELRRLVRFMHSPYFNNSTSLTRLCEFLIKAAGEQNPGFDKIEAWRAISPGEPYNDVNFRKHCSDLLNLLEVFFSHELLRNDEPTKAMNALAFAVERKMEPLYNKILKTIQKNLDVPFVKNSEYYLQRFKYEQMVYQLKQYDQVFDVKSNAEEMSHSLDFFYFIEKIKLYNAVLSQKRVGNFDYRIRLTEPVSKEIDEEMLKQDSELPMRYFSMLLLLDPHNETHYYRLRDILAQQAGSLLPKEAADLFEAALHYCTVRVNQGQQAFSQEYLDVFEIALRHKVFLDRGELAAWRFNNTVGIALRLGKLDWAEQFVREYKQYLPADTRENTYTFSLSRVFLYQKKFGKVMELLRNVEYEDIGYSLISKVILAIAYFELEEFETLDSFLESFRVYLNRHREIPEQRQRSYLNFVKFTRRLIRITPGDKPTAERLQAEIQQAGAATVNQDWLLEKVNELLG